MDIINNIKITVEVNQSLTTKVAESLESSGIAAYNVQSGRSVVYREKSVLFGISTKLELENDPIDIFNFWINKENETKIIEKIIHDANLLTPGHGSIWSEEVELTGQHEEYSIDNDKLKEISNHSSNLPSDLMAITTIVQRGQSDDVIKSILDMGFCVPSVIFGEGTGFRDKLGLLRITVPAEKEVIKIVVTGNDAEDAMNSIIDAGKLDQPGKGFIYMSPVKKGLINTKIFRGKMMHAASMEQVIAAMDAVKGNTEWRKRDSISGVQKIKNRKFLTNLIDLTLFSNEGTAEYLVNRAMSSGAAGATISKEKFITAEENTESISPAREKSDFIIGNAQKDVILKSLTSDSVFTTDGGHGIIEMKPVLKACTYLGGK